MDGVRDGRDDQDEGLDYRRRYRGPIRVHCKVPIRDRPILSLVSKPGVAEACLAIEEEALASFPTTKRDDINAYRVVSPAGGS